MLKFYLRNNFCGRFNETLVKALGFENPEASINEWLIIGGEYEAQIIGVFRDFNWASAHQAQENIVLGQSGSGRHISLRLSTTDLPVLIAKIESRYKEFFPANVFKYDFVDQIFDQQYKNDIRFATYLAYSPDLRYS